MLFPCLECLPFSSFGGWFCLIFRPQLKCHPISVHSIPCSSHFPLEQEWQNTVPGLATCFGEQSLLLHPFPYWLAGQKTFARPCSWSHSMAISLLSLLHSFMESTHCYFSLPIPPEGELHESSDITSFLLGDVTPEHLEVFNECILFQ